MEGLNVAECLCVCVLEHWAEQSKSLPAQIIKMHKMWFAKIAARNCRKECENALIAL